MAAPVKARRELAPGAASLPEHRVAMMGDAPLVLVSTLPNIHRHACAAQILEFEEQAMRRLTRFRMVHVSADEPDSWSEVDHFHPLLAAEGFSLFAASDESRREFSLAFGVAVEGHGRIAHGLFALVDGMFVGAEVPYQQRAVPDVPGFLDRVERLLGRRAS